MTTANHVWNQHKVNNGAVQFFASIMVMNYLESRYRTFGRHRELVMRVLGKRQYHPFDPEDMDENTSQQIF